MCEDGSCGCKSAKCQVWINGAPLAINDFVNHSLAGTILGYLRTLSHEGDIKSVKIEIDC